MSENTQKPGRKDDALESLSRRHLKVVDDYSRLPSVLAGPIVIYAIGDRP